MKRFIALVTAMNMLCIPTVYAAEEHIDFENNGSAERLLTTSDSLNSG